MVFKILCLDGGGIRGAISARILQEVEQQLKEHSGENLRLNQYFDLIAGTSTGSILAAGLCVGKTPEELVQIYQERGLEIFPYQSYYSFKRLPHIIKYKFSKLGDAWNGINQDIAATKSLRISPKRLKQFLGFFKTSPKFPHDGLIKVLSDPENLGNIKIKEIKEINKAKNAKAKLLLFAYDTLYRNTTFFCSHHSEANRWYDDMELWKICVSSSSAPTFFPPYEFRWRDPQQDKNDLDEWAFPHVDGGVSANNPSLAALIHAICEENRELKDIAILSIGTGRTTEPSEYEQVKSWGLIDWAERIPNVFMGGQLQITGGLCEQIMKVANPTSYLRIQFELNQRLGDRKTPTSPRQLLPEEKQVNQFTKEKVNEAIDDARKETVEQLIKTTEAFIDSQEEYTDGMPIKQAIANFIKAND